MGLRLTATPGFGQQLLAKPAPVLWALLVALAVALFVWVKPEPGPSEIRIRNDTGLPLSSVRINRIPYGDIDVGAVTSYLKHRRAYELASFSLTVGGILINHQLDDVVFPSDLGPGKFTYVLSLRGSGDPSSIYLRLAHE